MKFFDSRRARRRARAREAYLRFVGTKNAVSRLKNASFRELNKTEFFAALEWCELNRNHPDKLTQQILALTIEVATILRVNSRWAAITRMLPGRSNHIVRPPAALLARVGQWIMRKESYDRLVAPHVADIRIDYYEAIRAGQWVKARWVVLRGYWDALAPLREGCLRAILSMLALTSG